jgi:hypothetical protein
MCVCVCVCVCVFIQAKKQQIPILLSLVCSDRGSNPRSTTLEASTLTVTPPMEFHTCMYSYQKCESLQMTPLNFQFVQTDSNF